MFHLGKRLMPARARGARRQLFWLAAAWPLALSGCGLWDDFRGQDYSVKAFFAKEDPLLVLRDGKAEGNKRARALGALREPKQHGGTDADQQLVLDILTTAARSDPQLWCRLKAVEALSAFKDPRAVRGLKDAYYAAVGFTPQMQTVLRVQVLTALGQVGNPEALDLLVSVLKAPPAEEAANTDEDKQLYLDQRIAAAGALRHFKNDQAAEALAQVLREEKKETALRNSAHQSLEVVTGKRLPPDYEAWDEYLHPQKGGKDALAKKKATILPPVIPAGGREDGK